MEKNNLDGLVAFALVAEKRNFTAAAKALRVSPSAISKMIQQLETRLGVTLLTRTTRATSLSEAGERLLGQVGPALEVILAAMNDVGNLADKPSGRLRLNVPQLAYPNFLKPLVASFNQQYPEVTVELCFENAASDIFERGFDAGVRVSDILAKDMVALKLYGPLRHIVAAAPSYLDRFGRPQHPRDLLAHNCLCVGVGHRVYDRWEFEHRNKPFEVQVRGSLIMNDANLALDAAEDGAGLVYSDEGMISNRIKARRLEIVLGEYASASTGCYLYYPQRSQVPPKLRAFVEHVKKMRNV